MTQGDLFQGNGNGRVKTIEELRSEARLPLRPCPCCGRPTKLYRRKLNSGMVRALIALVRHTKQGEWLHLGKRFPSLVAEVQGDVSKLVHWGFAEAKPSDSGGSKRDSGVWRITPEGERFVRARELAPSHAFVRSPGNILVAMEETRIGVVEALGEHFDYWELMGGR